MIDRLNTIAVLAGSTEDLRVILRDAVHDRTYATAPGVRASAGQAILDVADELTRRGLSAW